MYDECTLGVRCWYDAGMMVYGVWCMMYDAMFKVYGVRCTMYDAMLRVYDAGMVYGV